METEQNEKLGRFISELRRSGNLTQKDLAEKLGVTDKAVSKWERGVSCPDISLLTPLAHCLEVSVTELLNGEKSIISSQKDDKNVVEEAISYSEKSTAFKVDRIKKNILTVITAAFLIAAIICVICELSITGHFRNLTWSIIVICSLFFSWVVILPVFRAKNGAVKKSLFILSISIIPYLAALNYILGSDMLLKLGACISVAAVIGIWCIYYVFVKWNNRKLFALGIFFIISIPVNWGINHIIAYFVEGSGTLNEAIVAGSLLALSVICFTADFLLRQRSNFIHS